MMTTSSISEIIRVGGWALRGAGFPFGVAERGASLLAWAEAVHGGAIEDVCHSEEAIKRSQFANIPARLRDSDGAITVNATGRHLLELGPTAVDLACAAAERSGDGYICLDNVQGVLFGTALAGLLAERGFIAIIAQSGSSDLQRSSVVLPQLILVRRLDGSPKIVAANLTNIVPGVILSELQSSELGKRLAVRLTEASKKPDSSFFAILCSKPSTQLANLIEPIIQVVASQMSPSDDLLNRFKDAYRLGVPVKMSDLKDLYALEVRTWAPTSERSRSQAGYGAFSATKASP